MVGRKINGKNTQHTFESVILYLTFNDAPSGIYESQVKDVVSYLEREVNTKTKLVAFVSLRNFLSDRKEIKKGMRHALVVPMFPGLKRWRWNALTLKIIILFLRPQLIIGRSVLATQLALKTGKPTVYDGRGAIAAEWKEYQVIQDPAMLQEIDQLEKECVLSSNFRIAVSEKLVEHWRQEFGYSSGNHVIIPCTLNKVFTSLVFNEETIWSRRDSMNYKDSDIVLVYSGSIAGWQSFSLLYNFLSPIMHQNPDVKLLFLSSLDNNIQRLMTEFKGRVTAMKVRPEEVPSCLMAADYGLLIREPSVTNRVASPVKFAEYLSCGLKVVISAHLGDYSDFVGKHACGMLDNEVNTLRKPALEDKIRNRNMALKHFTKDVFKTQYKHLTNLNL